MLHLAIAILAGIALSPDDMKINKNNYFVFALMAGYQALLAFVRRWLFWFDNFQKLN